MLTLQRTSRFEGLRGEQVEAQHYTTINKMLELTSPAHVWQLQLVEMLKPYIMEQDLKQALSFLQHVISVGKETLLQRTSSSSQHPCLHIDFRKAPRVLDVDRWKHILISLGFEIEQPDGFHNIEHVGVAVSQGVMIQALDGMDLLFSLLRDLQWNILRMGLRLSQDEAVRLCALVNVENSEVSDQEMAKSLSSKYPDEMKELGFQRENRVVIKTRTSQHQSQLCKRLALMLTAIYQQGPPSTGTFV